MSVVRLDPQTVRALTDQELRARVEAMVQARIRWAHDRPESFIEYALPHERTGQPVVNGRHHVEWQQYLDTARRAVLWAPVEHAKTSQISVGRLLWTIGRNPTGRYALISNTAVQASKILQAIRGHIEHNERVRQVFPRLARSSRDGDTWHSTALTVERPTYAKDPTLTAGGIGAPITGARFDGAVLDDVLDFGNTRTLEQLAKLEEWHDTTLAPRLTEHAFEWFVSTPWSTEDLGHRLARRPGFSSRRYSAVLNPTAPMTEWRPLWPEAFSRERLAEIYQGTTPRNFARKYLCEVRSDTSSRFDQAWIDAMLEAGKGWPQFTRTPVSNGIPWPTFTGVDLGVGEREEHDLSAIFTIAIEPTGKRRRVVCEIQSGRWTAPEIVGRILDVHARFGSIVLVESNGAQRFLLQFASDRGVPIRPFTTTSANKYDESFGVETLAVEMRAGLWLVPSGPDGSSPSSEAREWCRELLYYQPGAHTGDRLMASWFAREGARQWNPQIFGRHALQDR